MMRHFDQGFQFYIVNPKTENGELEKSTTLFSSYHYNRIIKKLIFPFFHNQEGIVQEDLVSNFWFGLLKIAFITNQYRSSAIQMGKTFFTPTSKVLLFGTKDPPFER